MIGEYAVPKRMAPYITATIRETLDLSKVKPRSHKVIVDNIRRGKCNTYSGIQAYITSAICTQLGVVYTSKGTHDWAVMHNIAPEVVEEVRAVIMMSRTNTSGGRSRYNQQVHSREHNGKIRLSFWVTDKDLDNMLPILSNFTGVTNEQIEQAVELLESGSKITYTTSAGE
ncbi:MAG: hypothetical protein DRR06_16990 [Gammaproteobacteria bacterium]|nr:MAG: hypothetical protein DRR06_16990 [Gammaproteobacteria bacterium]